ncbi:MAG: serine/threonine protein kinase [Dokdonella sp.]|uniref:serine/threonine protein kinase n=1 Tax=Dokdonella sp. TaxID=2291710 RepID=UPI002C7BD722|nr:serine/threonine protein kinase [Xanthomonadales bacterium]HQV72230.1 serine/threonine protein kinase [Dokdonella sp.]MBK7210278.1 serine/threonine protein kinase [Xanthomonadales bacterium]MBL0223730.1 serine/threonine protein kinase [Xanthomonadales bacterium]HQW75853.1 serine/threonine protein kinase [Dokdonella sp.]
MDAGAAPYATLSPDLILDAVAAAGHEPDGRMLALGSYENRVYQVGIEDAKPLIAKFYRPGRWSDAAIDEEHDFALELARAELPVVAPMVINGQTLLEHAGFRFSLYPRQGGRSPELESAENLAWMGRLLARIHGVGSRAAFHERGSIDVDTFVHEPSRAVLGSNLLPATLRPRYADLTERLADLLDQRLQACAPIRHIRLHGDCHRGNVLWTDAGPHFVDLDDARMGPAVQDLWMLASTPASLDSLLEGYAEFRDFDFAELALIEPLRIMRQVHWAGWVALRWHDPAFPLAFAHLGEARWWEEHCNDLATAIDLLRESVD